MRHCRRLLTQKDSPKEKSEFEKLVQVCRVARDLYYQENSQEDSIRSVFDHVGQVYDKSWGKKPIQEDGSLFSKDEILVGSTSCISREELYKGTKLNVNDIDSIACSVFDQVGQVYENSRGKKPIQEHGSLFSKDEILVGSTSCISREELYKGTKLNMNDIDSLGCSVFDQVGQVYEKSRGKKPIQEVGSLFSKDEILVGSTSCISREELFKGTKLNMNDIDSLGCSVFDQVGQVYEKSRGKKPIQEVGSLFSKDEILVGSTSCISREEFFKGSKLNMNDIDPLGCSVFDQAGQVYENSRGKKPNQEDGALFFKDEILVGCSTSCIAPEELFKGSKTNRGESSSARFCKLKIKSSGDDQDYFKGKKVVKWNDDDGDFLNKSDRFVEPEVFDGTTERKRSRKFFDLFEDDQDCEYSERKKKKPRSVCNARKKVARVASPLPVVFKNEIQEMGGTDIKLIIQKFLFSADMKGGQQRFSIPMKQIREDFLTDEEEIFLDQRSANNHVVPMIVPLIEPNLEKTRINFRKWAVNSSYVLSSPWNDIRDRNALKVDMEMQLWSFRVDGELNMALVKV